MLPDVIEDTVTDAAKRMGCQFTESIFYRYALEQGYGTRSEDKARELDTIWKRKGYVALPSSLKDWLLRVCDTPVPRPKAVFSNTPIKAN